MPWHFSTFLFYLLSPVVLLQFQVLIGQLRLCFFDVMQHLPSPFVTGKTATVMSERETMANRMLDVDVVLYPSFCLWRDFLSLDY
jgi:hypothetical protein